MPTASTSSAAEPPSPRAVAVWSALDPVIGCGRALRVLDVGGGTGNFAVPLARLGHDVTVVDPSADALATLARRAQTAGVGDRVRGMQGDGDRLREVLPRAESAGPDGGTHDGYDLVLCHWVLEVVDDPAATLREIAAALRPEGQVSIAATNTAGAVLGHALAGHPLDALAIVEGRESGSRRSRPVRRFAPLDLLALVRDAGLHADTWRGVAVVADLLDAASGADSDAVRTLELALAETSPYRDIATGLHLLAVRP